jgi:hypothetical protein
MRSIARLATVGLIGLLIATASVQAQDGTKAYRAMGLKPQDVLTGTVLKAGVVPGAGEQVVCLVTYLTGKSDQAGAVNVRLGVFEASGEKLVPIYTRDFGAERGGYIAGGDLIVLDVDRDGTKELIVSYDDFEQALVEQRVAEVILHDGKALKTAWSGVLEYDATKAARDVPQERRDMFVREFDWGATLKTRGATLFLRKKMLAVAGQRLDEPRVVEETFPLRGAPKNW